MHFFKWFWVDFVLAFRNQGLTWVHERYARMQQLSSALDWLHRFSLILGSHGFETMIRLKLLNAT